MIQDILNTWHALLSAPGLAIQMAVYHGTYTVGIDEINNVHAFQPGIVRTTNAQNKPIALYIEYYNA